ncbi:MAG: tetratricopeptide repeat protein [Candidatus Azobacteroides sp.]|nr:tetratricopeptide repeat protein [Candidatus Azobacteroides sp.]
MKYLQKKFISVCFLLFLCSSFAWAQDSVFQEQAEPDTVQIYIRSAQYRQAVEYINRLEPSKDMLYQKALCYKNLNDYPSAIDVLNTLAREYPDDIPIQLQLALGYEAVSQYMKSIDCYDYLLRIDSANTYFEVRKADLFYRSEKYALALGAYGRIDSTYNPNYITRCMAMCYEKLNQTDSAKSYYDKAWESDARDAYSANSLVKIQIKEDDYISAYQNSEKYIQIDSANATMNALNAFIYYNMKYYDIAIERFEKCLQQGDSSLLVNRSLGFSYYLTEKDSLAYPFLQQAFLQDTTNTNVLYILGKTDYKLGYYSEAIECFLKIIEKLTSSDVLLCNINKELAVTYEKNGAFDYALEAYHTALNYARDNTEKMELYYSMAVLSENELKNYTPAVAYYKEYRRCLFNYQSSLTDEQEINEIESKLTALDEHIEQLTVKPDTPE